MLATEQEIEYMYGCNRVFFFFSVLLLQYVLRSRKIISLKKAERREIVEHSS